jgi:hypothetical protein
VSRNIETSETLEAALVEFASADDPAEVPDQESV